MRRSHRTIRFPFPTMGLALALGLVLSPALAAPAAGQVLADYDYEHLALRGVGFDVGFLWSDRINDTQRYTVRLDLGYLGPGVRIVPSISYWRSKVETRLLDDWADRLNQQTGATLTGADLGPIHWSDLSITVDGQFVWSVPFGAYTYIGLGAGVHALNGRGPAVDDTFVEDLLDDVTAGVDGLVGLELELGERFRVYGEARYTAMTSLQYASLRAGAQIMFSRGDVEVGAVAPPAMDDGGVAP